MHAHLSIWSTLSLIGSVARLEQFPNTEVSAYSLATAVKAQELDHDSYRRIILFSFLNALEIILVESSLGLRVELVPRKLLVQGKLVKQKLIFHYSLSHNF